VSSIHRATSAIRSMPFWCTQRPTNTQILARRLTTSPRSFWASSLFLALRAIRRTREGCGCWRSSAVHTGRSDSGTGFGMASTFASVRSSGMVVHSSCA